MDNMYAKVNKPLKCKQRDSGEIDDKHSSKSDQASSPISQNDTSYEEVAFRSCAPVGKTKSDPVDRRGSYEEVSFQPSINIRPESLGKKEKKKVKGSVKDRIKKFEKSSSKDGDENILEKSDSDSNKTPPTQFLPNHPHQWFLQDRRQQTEKDNNGTILMRKYNFLILKLQRRYLKVQKLLATQVCQQTSQQQTHAVILNTGAIKRMSQVGKDVKYLNRQTVSGLLIKLQRKYLSWWKIRQVIQLIL